MYHYYTTLIIRDRIISTRDRIFMRYIKICPTSSTILRVNKIMTATIMHLHLLLQHHARGKIDAAAGRSVSVTYISLSYEPRSTSRVQPQHMHHQVGSSSI